jgi:hypothetical protein
LLDQKNQKSSQPLRFFALLGLYPAKQVKPGEGPVAAFTQRPSLQATFRTPLQPHRPASFYLLSPEAARLTLVQSLNILQIKCEQTRPKSHFSCFILFHSISTKN